LFDFKFDIITRALPSLWEGSLVTLKITLLSFCFSVLIGFMVGILRSESKFFYYFLTPYVEVFRGTPLLIQLFFIYYGLPTVNITLTSFQAAIIGLGLNGAAYISEVVRSSLFAIEKQQRDAAYALGMNWWQGLRHVIMPQALPISVPPLMNIFASQLKETSLISVLAITELTRVGQLVYTRSFRAFEIYLTIGVIYLVMTLTVAQLSKLLERRFLLHTSR
jgi:polar amino acid transport system permease protein